MDAFLNSTDVRSAIENVIALGGDISVRAVIAGSIAEGFYGVSYSEKEMCNRLLPENMLEIMDRFDKFSQRNFLEVPDNEEDLTDELIENAIRQFNKITRFRYIFSARQGIVNALTVSGYFFLPRRQ